MAKVDAIIETLEHRLMRAWIRGDMRELKPLIDRGFLLHFAGDKRVVLDRLSFLEAAKDHFQCTAYQISDIHVRKLGGVASLSARFNLDLMLHGKPLKGSFWVQDVWAKSRLRRSYRLVDRSISKFDGDSDVAARLRALQLWR